MGILDVPSYSRQAADARFTNKAVPSYAGTRAGSFDRRLSLYNATETNLRKLRMKIAAAKQGGSCRLALCGDSETRGFGATFQKSWPIQLQALLTGAGAVLQGSFIGAGDGGAHDSRVTYGTGGGDATGMTRTIAAGGTVTFVTDTACTSLYIVFQDNGNPFSFTVDGAAPASGNVSISGTGTYSAGTVTPGNTSTYKTATVTGLSNATHTVVITGAAGSFSTWVQGVMPVGATPGLLVVNAGESGSKASSWKRTGTNEFQQVQAALSPNPDVVLFSLGVNDINTGGTVATYKTDYTAAINLATATGAAVLLVVEPHPSPVAQATWEQAVAAQYDIADSLGLPLLDIYHRWGNYTTANGLGVMFDTLHPNPSGYADTARAVFNVLNA